MGGIKLDWHVESEQSQTRATEDPLVRQRRRAARRQFLAILAALVIVVGAIVGAILWRLNDVENEIKRDLLDTVEAEVTALRIGDLANYTAIQRSASDTFMLEQSQRFEYYQQLKQDGRIQLTGRVVSTAIDDQRARVVLEEIIDGVPYHVVWFYWRYAASENDEGGWRHVPDDLTFWGEERTITTGSGRVIYNALDHDLARALADRLPVWWARGCELLACPTPPPDPTIRIVAEQPPAVEWNTPDGWTLRVTSPLVSRARADVPLPPDFAQTIAQQLAMRLVRHATGDVIPDPASDAAWLQADYARWMAGHMRDQLQEAGGFMESLIALYGPGVPGTVLNTLASAAPVGGAASFDNVMLAVTGVPLSQLSADQLNTLDWRAFFRWRLELETALLREGDREGFLALYDTADSAAFNLAVQNADSPTYAARPVPVVREVQITQENGQLYAWVTATYTENGLTLQDASFLWRWANGTWRRVR